MHINEDISMLELNQNYIGVLITRSFKEIKDRPNDSYDTDLYNATRFKWQIADENIKKFAYVVGLISVEGKYIAKSAYKVNNWHTLNKGDISPINVNEIIKAKCSYFDGEVIENDLINKDVSSYFENKNNTNNTVLYPRSHIDYSIKGENVVILSKNSLNQILYGPPGTGKTYNTVIKALEIIDPDIIKEFNSAGATYELYKNKLLPKYNDLRKSGQIEFVTFHQSYGYEEFVEGIKPIIENDLDDRDFYEISSRSENKSQLSYEIVSGCFKRLSLLAKKIVATTQKAEIKQTSNYWKLSLGNTAISEAEIVYQYCLDNSVVQLGYGYGVDLSNANSSEEVKKLLVDESEYKSNDYAFRVCNTFKNKIKINDFIIISHGNTKFKAIAQVVGEYTFLSESIADEKGVFTGNLPVKWVYISKDLLPYEKILNKKFSQQALYNIKSNIEIDKFQDFINPDDNNSMNKKYVLIIDEINRGNISKIFGELITLIEESKREVMAVTLPYSGESFSVPNNLYIIGTMNTADRSIALMDTALRRRFDFVEMQPDYDALEEEATYNDVNLSKLLQVINQRIEYLYDRDHTIGHAYFIGITDFAGLCSVFANKIIPLLQEYFYDDWEKIRLVLADNQVNKSEYQFIQTNRTTATSLFGTSTNDLVETDKITYIINEALKHTEKDPQQIDIKAFTKIYDNEVLKQVNKPARAETSQDQGS